MKKTNKYTPAADNISKLISNIKSKKSGAQADLKQPQILKIYEEAVAPPKIAETGAKG